MLYIHIMHTYSEQVNTSHTFMAGGWDDTDAYLYDWTAEVWTQLPNTGNVSDDLACAVSWDSKGDTHILQAGDSFVRKV